METKPTNGDNMGRLILKIFIIVGLISYYINNPSTYSKHKKEVQKTSKEIIKNGVKALREVANE